MTRLFILLSGAVLLAAALTRFLILLGNVPQLHQPDPLLGLPLALGLFLAGAAELTVALLCLFGRRTRLQAGLIAWLACNYTVMRAGMYYTGIHPDWTCIGSLTDPLHLARGLSGLVVDWVLPGGLLAGSVAVLLAPWVRVLFPPRSAFAKMSCPACGGHIRFSLSNLDRETACPHCRATVRLGRDVTLKMSCYFCKGHIAFPAHALGTKLSCPHCKMDITLKELV